MKHLIIAVAVALVFLSCGDGNVVIQVDPEVQFQEDSLAIMDYLDKKGYEIYSYSQERIWYLTLEQGAGEIIDESDFISYNYTAGLLNDTIFDTTIKAVGDSIRAHFLEDSVGLADKSVHEFFLASFSEDRDYEALTHAYTTSGWNLSAGFPYDPPGVSSNQRTFGDGVKKGISIIFDGQRVGTKTLFIIPSQDGFGSRERGVISANSPLVFEIVSTNVIKQ